MQKHLERVFGELRARGMRLTPARRTVVEGILAVGGHFDAEGLAQQIGEGKTKVSRATVYRTVSCLVDLGLLRRYDLGDRPAEFETTLGRAHHEHMICDGCGRVLEFVEDRIERLQEEVCRKHGFLALRHTLQIHGLCSSCADARTVAPPQTRALAAHGSRG